MSEEAVKFAHSEGYLRGKAQGLRTLGFCLIRTSDPTSAMNKLDVARRLFEEIDDGNMDEVRSCK